MQHIRAANGQGNAGSSSSTPLGNGGDASTSNTTTGGGDQEQDHGNVFSFDNTNGLEVDDFSDQELEQEHDPNGLDLLLNAEGEDEDTAATTALEAIAPWADVPYHEQCKRKHKSTFKATVKFVRSCK